MIGGYVWPVVAGDPLRGNTNQVQISRIPAKASPTGCRPRRRGGESAMIELTSMEVVDMDATREQLHAEFKALIDDAEAFLKATAGQAGEAVTTARQRIEQRLEEGKRSLAEAEVLLIDKSKEAAKTAEVYVRENPWNAVGIAAGVGLVLGLILRRR